MAGSAPLVAAVRTAKQFPTYVSAGPFHYAVAEALAGPFHYAVAEALALPDPYYADFRQRR